MFIEIAFVSSFVSIGPEKTHGGVVKLRYLFLFILIKRVSLTCKPVKKASKASKYKDNLRN